MNKPLVELMTEETRKNKENLSHCRVRLEETYLLNNKAFYKSPEVLVTATKKSKVSP
jgi:hypothetical protein